MNYIQQAYKGFHEWWRYLVGSIVIFIAWQIVGMIPLLIAMGIKMAQGAKLSLDNMIYDMANMLGNNLFLFLMLTSFAVGLIGVFFSSKVLHKLSIKDLTTTRDKIDWSRFWFIFILWGVLSTGLTFADYFMTPEDYVVNIDWGKFALLAVIVVLFIPLQTSFEEYFFRGYLMHGFGILFKNNWAPLIITSLGFGLLHLANPEVDTLGPMIMVFYIGTGLLLGIMTLMDDGLELALGFHAANNLFTALLVTADWTALQTDSILKDISDPSKITFAEIAVPILVMFPLILFVLAKKYNWTNWKDKLFGKVTPPPKEDYKIME
ncbi:MAG: CPBP family intramembrane metalloprotease [Psychroserpens sp.]|nr:CPBP family intramembrane metalloprotease [Psychroserpens sp.]